MSAQTSSDQTARVVTDCDTCMGCDWSARCEYPDGIVASTLRCMLGSVCAALDLDLIHVLNRRTECSARV